MKFVITSKILGRKVTFSRPSCSYIYADLNGKLLERKVTFLRPNYSYIYADLNGKPGTLGQQICEGGAVMAGSAMTYSGDDDAEFASICRKWYRAYIRNH